MSEPSNLSILLRLDHLAAQALRGDKALAQVSLESFIDNNKEYADEIVNNLLEALQAVILDARP